MTKIRLADAKDVPFLEDVERSAAAAYRIFQDHVPSSRVVPQELLAGMAAAKRLWVAISGKDEIVGFVACEDMDGLLYVHEISVAYDFQKQGIGRDLMLTVLDAAIDFDSSAIGLTTRRDVVWNLPFYKKLGFVEITDDREWPYLFARLQKEIAEGADPNTRCAMVKRL